MNMKQYDKVWTTEEIIEIYNRPLLDLVFEAASVHRKYHDPNKIQVSTLISIKTGGCSEDCAYCPQAARYFTDVETNELLSVKQVEIAAKRAKLLGSSRLCMGAAWRSVKDNSDFDHVLDLVKTVHDQDLEVCCTLGMVSEQQAQKLADAGLYAYNHNLDSSEEFYKEIISTRGYEDRLKTLENVRKANMTICSGGIIGMGESVKDRCNMLLTLSQLKPQPESVPINALVAVEGTPLEEQETVEIWEMIRMVATTRIVLPQTTVRLSAGRTNMSKEGQVFCFMAGASSIFAGDKLLTTPNPDIFEDLALFDKIGISVQEPYEKHAKPERVEGKTYENEETTKWSRPAHKIEANEKYKALAKEKRTELKNQD